jgi:hypothetical protein
MSEESKTPDTDYVHMGAGGMPGGSGFKLPDGLNDPTLSQEDRDLRLALALQQQENAAAYDAHKKKHDAAVAANASRTTRSNAQTKLTAAREKQTGGVAGIDGDYQYLPPASAVPPIGASAQEIADFQLASSLQKVEQLSAGIGGTAEKILKESTKEAEAQAHRTEHSNYHINQKGLPFVRKI